MPKKPTTVLRAVLFTDVVGSTELARELGDQRWTRLLQAHRRIVRDQLRANRGREVDTAGDGFFAVFEGPTDAVRCAFAVARKVQVLGLDIRAGIHFGEIETSGTDAHGRRARSTRIRGTYASRPRPSSWLSHDIAGDDPVVRLG